MSLPKLRVRRNTIVKHPSDPFYGRVIRLLPNGEALWLSSGLYFFISKVEDLETGNYTGYTKQYWSGERYSFRKIHMTSLRQLKRYARRFHHEFAHNTPLDYDSIQRT